MKKNILIFGSARRNGNTGKLIDLISEAIDIEIIDLSQFSISAYDYEHRNLNDDFIPLMQTIIKYDNLIFATPVYWYGPSAQMKTFIDRTSDFLDIDELKDIGRSLRNKNAYIACTSISNKADPNFIRCFEKTFDYLGMIYRGSVHADCNNGFFAENCKQELDLFIEKLKQE